MIPGPDSIFACPHCNALAKSVTLASGNTFGATYWTDGKCIAPMLPEVPAITRCTTCHQFYWVIDASVIGEVDIFQSSDCVPAEWLDADYIQPLSAHEYVRALEIAVATTPAQERFLRIQLWWTLNDPYRTAPDTPVHLLIAEEQQIRVDNFECLLHLLTEAIPEDLVLRAEIARESGDFREAITLLQETLPPELLGTANTIQKWAAQQDRIVREILL
jgi:hypothetical protein